MSIMRWNPFGELYGLRRQMDRIFDRVMPSWDVESPRIDIYQTEDEVIATAELPGIESKDDIELFLSDGALTIRGEIKRKRDLKDENFYHTERFFGNFSRTLPLPAEVKTEEASASYQNGLLEVRLPKVEKGKRKAIKLDIH